MLLSLSPKTSRTDSVQVYSKTLIEDRLKTRMLFWKFTKINPYFCKHSKIVQNIKHLLAKTELWGFSVTWSKNRCLTCKLLTKNLYIRPIKIFHGFRLGSARKEEEVSNLHLFERKPILPILVPKVTSSCLLKHLKARFWKSIPRETPF